MLVIPEDYSSKPSQSFAECLLSKTPPKPLPDRLSESATCPGSQPEAISPKAPFDTPLKQTLRSFLRNMPRVPKVKPKATPQALRSRPEIPSGSTLGTRHVFPSAERKPFLREPSEPPRVPRLTPGESRIPPASPECAARSASDSFPRMPSVAPRVPSEPEPQTSRMPPGSPRITPGRPSRTLGECAACRSSQEQTFCLL